MMTRYDRQTMRAPLVQGVQPLSRDGSYAVFVIALATIFLLTQAYRTSALFGIRASYVSVFTSILILILSLSIPKLFISILKINTFIIYIALFLITPILSMLFVNNHFSIELYFRYITYLTLLIAGFIIGFAYRDVAINKLILSMIFIISLSALTSLFVPDIFSLIASDAGANISYDQRAFGFFLQPNALAVCLVFIYSRFDSGVSSRVSEYSAFFLVLGTIVISGSRFGLILLLVLQFFKILLTGYRQGKEVSFLGRAFSVMALFLFLYLLSLLIAQFLANSIGSIGGLGDRILNLMQFRFGHSGDLGEINSLNLRLQQQEIYLDLIRNSFTFGYGFGFEKESLRSGQIELAAHSTVLSMALDFGIIYVGIFILAAVLPFRKIIVGRSDVRYSYMHFILIFLLATFAYHGALENGVITFSMGLLLAKIYGRKQIPEMMPHPVARRFR